MNKFYLAKSELVRLMERGHHCKESIKAVLKSRSIGDLIGVIKSFRTELTGKPFPSVDFLRKWFSKEADELSKHGVYLDEERTFTNYDMEVSYLFGCSKIEISSSRIAMKYIVCRNNSVLKLHAEGFSLWHIVLQDNSALEIINKDEFSRIILIDKRKK